MSIFPKKIANGRKKKQVQQSTDEKIALQRGTQNSTKLKRHERKGSKIVVAVEWQRPERAGKKSTHKSSQKPQTETEGATAGRWPV
ncbi:unnamed protein product [Ceratitis capitata]|uniref:(Mediterranean fruit fly) hypothetical protein n=1 Tax=Ceratitis capitata TaxID=7213 RepID=A0A811V2L7_CERCA|nr:unnamed protein product [Ceratitis capitata]